MYLNIFRRSVKRTHVVNDIRQVISLLKTKVVSKTSSQGSYQNILQSDKKGILHILCKYSNGLKALKQPS